MSKTPSIYLALESVWNLLWCAFAFVTFLLSNIGLIIVIFFIGILLALPPLTIPWYVTELQNKGFLMCVPLEKGVKCEWTW